jgi:hypothetical protein
MSTIDEGEFLELDNEPTVKTDMTTLPPTKKAGVWTLGESKSAIENFIMIKEYIELLPLFERTGMLLRLASFSKTELVKCTEEYDR